MGVDDRFCHSSMVANAMQVDPLPELTRQVRLPWRYHVYFPCACKYGAIGRVRRDGVWVGGGGSCYSRGGLGRKRTARSGPFGFVLARHQCCDLRPVGGDGFAIAVPGASLREGVGPTRRSACRRRSTAPLSMRAFSLLASCESTSPLPKALPVVLLVIKHPAASHTQQREGG